MKQLFSALILLLGFQVVNAQNPRLNPLNYSGKMPVTSFEVITTPRYISYNDHALLSTEMSMPMMEPLQVEFDFKNKIIKNITEDVTEITNIAVKEYTNGKHTTIVIHMDVVDSTGKLEFVWPPLENPYLLVIEPSEEKAAIVKYNFKHGSSSTTSEDALLKFLNN